MHVPEFVITPCEASFGAVVTRIDLTALDAPSIDALRAAWLEYALLVFPGQHLSIDAQNAFARHFGALEFEAAPLANVRRDGSLRPDDGSDDVVAILRGNMAWHMDSTYMPLQAKGAVFSAHVVPATGGATEWADMRAAYEALDDATKARVAELAAHHSLAYSQGRLGHAHDEGSEYSGYGFGENAQLRPLVKLHPETGRPALVIGRHAHAIPGLGPEASERLLDELLDFACRPPRVVSHQWEAGDVVLWDNRCLLHRARPWDMREPRVMYHTRIAGEAASEAGLAPAV
ncbi:MAG: TauD/TfdA family dioxygenase [Pseudomonadales bacterium]|jgi:alpha-ketoglutarate-dependent taurine dioxygenase|nr:TauD/TfdA family dioxygenase [Pseudomonadales bacterium]